MKLKNVNHLAVKCFRVELFWIKAHNNYTGNEMANEKDGNAVYNIMIHFHIDPPNGFFKNNERMTKMATENYTSCKGDGQLKLNNKHWLVKQMKNCKQRV